MKKKLFESKDKKQKSHMGKLLIQSKLRNKMIETQKKFLLQPTETVVPDQGEHLLQYRQKDFKQSVSKQNQQQIFDLQLDFGDYFLDYSLNGRNLLLGSSLGHVCLMEWKNKNLLKEFHVRDKIRDIKFLHNVFFGVAQQNNVFIYDQEGLEIHQLTQIQEPQFLEYLPYHYTMAAISQRGKVVFIDCSTGQTAAEIKTKIQPPKCLVKNPQNGLMAVGSTKGTVSFFTPNSSDVVLKVLCHNSMVNSVDFTQNGYYMSTVGSDN